MSTTPLPRGANLEHLKKQAKRLLRSYRAGDVHAVARVRARFPDRERVGIDDVQLVLAREHGFPSWSQLRRHIDDESRYFPRKHALEYVQRVVADAMMLAVPGTGALSVTLVCGRTRHPGPRVRHLKKENKRLKEERDIFKGC